MRQHSRNGEEFTWYNVDLMEGLAAPAQPTNNAPHATQSAIGRGRVIRVIGDDESGTLAYVCSMATDAYRQLYALKKADKLNENVVGLGLYKNRNLGLTIKYKNMSILDFPPPPIGGTEAGQVTITFGYEERDETQDNPVPTVGQ